MTPFCGVPLPCYLYIVPYGLAKFCCFAVNTDEKSDEWIAEEGISCMKKWMKELDLVMNLGKLGVTQEMLNVIVDG